MDMEKDKAKAKDGFRDALTVFMEQAYHLQEKCQQILQQCYSGEVITLPVDIKKVVQGLGVKLESEDLNCGSEGGIDTNIASLRYMEGGDEEESGGEEPGDAVIYVNKDENQDASKGYSDLHRYAIAYELGKIIIDERIEDGKASKMSLEEVRRWNMMTTPYSLPKLYAHWESFAYEMCAIFLLLPLDLFLKEFASYIEEAKEYPVKMDKWIKHLGDKAGIPNYQLINGYQYIKFCACQYYQDIIKVDNEADEVDYRELYR